MGQHLAAAVATSAVRPDSFQPGVKALSGHHQSQPVLPRALLLLPSGLPAVAAAVAAESCCLALLTQGPCQQEQQHCCWMPQGYLLSVGYLHTLAPIK